MYSCTSIITIVHNMQYWSVAKKRQTMISNSFYLIAIMHLDEDDNSVKSIA